MAKTKMTRKTCLMNFLETFPAGTEFTWSELHEFIVLEKLAETPGRLAEYFSSPREFRGYMCYFAAASKDSYFLRPSIGEPRYIMKTPNGKYILKAA